VEERLKRPEQWANLGKQEDPEQWRSLKVVRWEMMRISRGCLTMKVTSDNGGGLEEKLGRAWRELKNGGSRNTEERQKAIFLYIYWAPRIDGIGSGSLGADWKSLARKLEVILG